MSSGGTEPDFFRRVCEEEPVWVVCFMVAGRLGSPMISSFVVGTVEGEKGVVRVMENSEEGGGAMERGMMIKTEGAFFRGVWIREGEGKESSFFFLFGN